MNVRKDFPFFQKNPNVIYFDNAATTLKPQVVIDEVVHYYENTANVGRGDYNLSFEVTQKYEHARANVAKFIGADSEEIVFMKNTSDTLNFVAKNYCVQKLQQDDIILTTKVEHASLLLPFMQITKQKKAKLQYLDLCVDGTVDINALKKRLTPQVKFIVVSHISNVVGIENDMNTICELAHLYGVEVIVDAAQSVAHTAINVKTMNCDFLAFSGHKMYAPTGVGVLFAKKACLKNCVVSHLGGGNNIKFNEIGEISVKEIPHCFEVGTPNIEAVLGLNAAISYIEKIGMKKIHEVEKSLSDYFLNECKKIPHIEVYSAVKTSSIVLFNVKNIFAQDVASYLNQHHIAVRTGGHCSKLAYQFLNVPETIRVSFAFYNTKQEIDMMLNVLKTINLEKTLDIFF